MKEQTCCFFQLLFNSKFFIKNLQIYEFNQNQLTQLKTELQNISLQPDFILHQLLQKHIFYQQFKLYVHEKLFSIPLLDDDLPSLMAEKCLPLSCRALANKKIELEELAKKIGLAQDECIEIAQQLNLLEMRYQITEEKEKQLKNLCLKKMIMVLFKRQSEVKEKIFLKPFMQKLIIVQETIICIVLELYTVLSHLLEQTIQNEQADLFFHQDPAKSQQFTKSALTSSVQIFLENEEREKKNRKKHNSKLSIKSDFVLNRSSKERNRAELTKHRNSTCCWNIFK